MTPHQRAVATRFLDAGRAQREPVVVALSGAYAYGFPSPDSDLDLKGIHVAPTRALLGLERILGELLLVRSALLAELQPLVQTSLSQRSHHHYRGFALNQRHEAERTRRAKKVLYVLRTTLTGTHLLRTGELVTDVTRLAPVSGFELGELLEAKSKAEKQPLSEEVYASAVTRMDRAFATLDDALPRSVLPVEPPNVAAIEAWLVETRVRRA